MEIKYATGLTTITNANSGTLERIENIVDDIIEQTTEGLQINNLKQIREKARISSR